METKNKKSFEGNLETLEDIVKKLENGDIPLDDAIDKFNEGMKIANECNKILEDANETITKAMNKNGDLEDFKIEE